MLLTKMALFDKKIIFFSILLTVFNNLNKIAGYSLIEERGINGKPLSRVATFHFPEYAYKETSKNEIAYHDFEVNCQEHGPCIQLEGISKIACIRRCISPSCYQDIYAFDELEEGEIDVRMNSFKGCVIQRSSSKRRM